MNHSVLKRLLLIVSKIIFCVFICVLTIILVCDQIVERNASKNTFSDVNLIPNSEVGLVLGTTPQTRLGTERNLDFDYRIEAATSLFKAHKVKSLLLSGDGNSLGGVNEPVCMKTALMEKGVSSEAIILDEKGLRTYDSIVRLNRLYGVKNFTIISQPFHNERALYLAQHLDLDIETVYAFNAKEKTDVNSKIVRLREYLARVKMFLDIYFL